MSEVLGVGNGVSWCEFEAPAGEKVCSIPLTGRWYGRVGLGEEIVEVLKAGFGGRMDGRVRSRCQLEALVVWSRLM